ncbi:MAG: adenylate/guanylate cyclase domain-containing protein [Dehalococcoidia bacterium]|nr:adenylate/guanylate cyclase domain-containing protein [Dehalococcoidia bacterium]MCA9831110.1 adenylate/guanylate cyclase domain-containing protein [Dehalococcoidia bacterium]MCB9485581.1 adenylate/guanylate cyclase domain-containing protein [Thermoflexaceae bacterium]
MPPLFIVVRSEGSEESFVHQEGPLEFGRGPGREYPRCTVADPYASRDHVRITPVDDGVLVENLSLSSDVFHDRGPGLGLGDSTVVPLPVAVSFGRTQLELSEADLASWDAPTAPIPSYEVPYEPALTPSSPLAREVDGDILAAGLETIVRPAAASPESVVLRDLGESPDPETLARWFETVVLVQQAAATSAEFLEATARAVVDLVGMDSALVLLREGEDGWRVAARTSVSDWHGSAFSTTILGEVVRLARTIYRNLGSETATASLVGIETVVAAPLIDASGRVFGALYGSRLLRINHPSPDISPLEARVVQVLAAAAGAGIAREREREEALRMEVQFEQFFSPTLARQLVEDRSLLDGRDREVTVMFSDVRNFSRISERLGAARTFNMMQDIMDLQSQHIRDTDGVVVDYVGDGLLAMWNAPASQPDHPARACTTARAIVAALPTLSERWEPETGEPIRLGIGVNSGPAIVGNTGSRLKFKYGPMGPTVNLASRVENATKTLGVGLLVTSGTRQRLPPEFATRRLGGLRVQGVAAPVDVFELAPAAASPLWLATRDRFEQALASFESRQWPEACRILVELVSAGAQYDSPTLQLLSRAVDCMRTNPDPFDPSITVEKAI